MKPVIPLLTMFLALSGAGMSAEKARPLAHPPSLATPFESSASELNNYAALQKELGIQNADLAYAMRKALIMAELLVKADGTLDLDSRPIVKSTFLSSNPEEYEINMGNLLDHLDSSWQQVFANVRLPVNGTSLLALRAFFSLSRSQPLTDRHAKVALLAAMLAPFNQGPVGDCFAVSVVIRDHEEYFLHAAEDYSSIVMNGRIDRPVNGKIDSFFFLPALADGDRDQPFHLALDGTFPNSSSTLFDAPGFAAAKKLMGGEEAGISMADCLSSLSQYVQGGQISATPAEAIAAMASVIASKTGQDPSQVAAIGNYAFSCLTNNPILRGCESAFAAMAEDRLNDSTRGNINSCIAQSLQSTWDSLSSAQSAASFQQALAQNFDASYRLLYNLDIPLAQVSSDGSSTDGGFQLYRRVPGNTAVLGTRVATPQDLEQLVLDAITATAGALDQTADVQTISQTLSSVVQTGDFLKNALWAYDQANQQEPDPVGNYQKLSRTPMQSCDGDNPFEVSDIDTGVSYDNNVQSYTPGNAKDLITWCLTLAKTAPLEFIPMDSPQHAFNFVPANPDIAAFLQMNMPIGQWIQNRLVVPGIGISRKKIDASVAQAIANVAYDQIANALQDDQGYRTLVENILKKNLSVKDFSASLVNGITGLLGANATSAHEIAQMVDAVTLQNLSANDQAILCQSAVRFAFTNWNQGTDDIYFCAYFNPRTEQVGFGTIFENKSNLQPMDEDAWVNHQQWDVDLTPAAPVDAAQH